MGISVGRFDSHFEEWTKYFTNYRKLWPGCLFRHEPLENVISILKSGSLLSRNDAAEFIHNDIAPDEIINSQDVAHSKVRLYFRPRTPTQFHIEGIRKEGDYYLGKHAGFLVMLVFDAKSILTLPNTFFSCGNMQSTTSQILNGDIEFDSLEFLNIYHDQANPSAEQIRQRCAEVLPVCPMDINQHLTFILVRTDSDLQTVKYILKELGLGSLTSKVKKSSGPGVMWTSATIHLDSCRHGSFMRTRLMEYLRSGLVNNAYTFFRRAGD